MDPGRLRAYFQATRPYSFTATLVPVLIGTGVAKVLFPSLALNGIHFALALLGALGVHTVSNVLNDVFDARSGLDNRDNYGRFNAVVAGLTTPKEMLGIAAVSGALAIAIGLYFLTIVGTPILVLMILGGFLAVFYTMPPLSLKHRSLGDLAVLLGFGLGMAYGAYVVQAHAMPGYLAGERILAVFAYAFPSALPMVAILWANNHRDRLNDRQYGARTLANVLSPEVSKRVMALLLVAPLALFAVTSLLGLTTGWVLLALLSVPPMRKILGEVQTDRFDGPLVPQIAGYHGLFGLLTTLGLAVRALVR